MISIRIHGRGGQGVVATAEIIALAAFRENWFCQAFPAFGVERSGAPISSFVRLDKKVILTHEQVYKPEIIIISDATLLSALDVSFGANEKTLFLINSGQQPEEISRLMKTSGKQSFIPKKEKIKTIDASTIALEIFGKNLNNTALLGALAKVSSFANLTAVKKAIKEKFKEKGDEVIKKNLLAASLAYEKIK